MNVKQLIRLQRGVQQCFYEEQIDQVLKEKLGFNASKTKQTYKNKIVEEKGQNEISYFENPQMKEL